MTRCSAIIPVLRYADAPAAIAFLCEGFGFGEHARFTDPADPGQVVHAELILDQQLIMLSSARPTDFSTAAPMITVAQAGGCTASLYLVIDDVDGHAARALARGADIFMPPHNPGEGGRSYSARDPEGNCWTFGSYDPFDRLATDPRPASD